LESSSFDIEKIDCIEKKILPVYPLTKGLKQMKLRMLICAAMDQWIGTVDSELPKPILEKYHLLTKRDVLLSMHTPRTLDDVAKGKHSLIFEEFFSLQMTIGMRSLQKRGRLPLTQGESDQQSAIPSVVSELSLLQKKLHRCLPFELTVDQKRVITEITQDLEREEPMARLIQGDVGSGKTLVAFFSCLKIIEQGGQVALLAPTELLARQHADTAARLLAPIGIRLAFLTGNVKSEGRAYLLEALVAGEINLVVGTHALFSKSVRYHDLRLVIIDEQHRFGVLQRSALIQKGREGNPQGKTPHIIMMSATPIPRTLALSVFGDLDISIIKSMPGGRKPVITYIARKTKAEKVYEFVGNEIEKGRQAYFIYPRIHDIGLTDLKSVQCMYMYLKNYFARYAVAMIHSKMTEEEQQRIMKYFSEGTVHILVATSVVEVGVDVPNANCIVIEHAERFGLSALHQLRGRVGRGDVQSYCFLMHGDEMTECAKRRLKIMGSTADGFVIAEEDLKLRGPGDVGDTKNFEQSGYSGFRVADPVRDYPILQVAREAAFELLRKEKGSSEAR
ncbi:ATP-dependent DNA helicase RecG, partial [Treponema pallidum]